MKAMKKVLALALALAMVVTAVPVTSAEAANLTAGKSKKITYYVGKTNTLKLTGVKASNIKSTTWSKNGSKAVNLKSKAKTSAKVQVVKAGKAKVTATVKLKSGKTKKYTMNITAKNPSLTVSASSTTLKLGETATLTVAKKPSTATVKYSSSDEAVASISKGIITANGIGNATITVKLTCGTKTITKTVAIEVVAGKDGLAATLTNQFASEYENTVLVNEDAVINVAYTKDGKPVSGQTVVIGLTGGVGTVIGPWDSLNQYVIKGQSTAVTNANGIATFVIGNNANIKASNGAYVASVNYKVQVPTDSTVTEGTVNFAAVKNADITNVNNHNTDLTDNLVPSVNYTAVPVGRGGLGLTASMDDPADYSDEYVVSQQVSSEGSNEHEVIMTGGYPVIALPGTTSADSIASKQVDTLNYTSGKYNTYASNSYYYVLKEDPNKLTYATLNFDKVTLSKYTALVVETYKTEKDAKDGNLANRLDVHQYDGEMTQSSFGYQIPLSTGYTNLCVKVTLVSAGQVDTAKNEGYTAKEVVYVYKKFQTTGGNAYPLKNATVEWSVVATPYTAETDITTTRVKDILGTGNDNTLVKDQLGIVLTGNEKLTQKLPVFPYTGTAVLTKYDANNKVVAYYAVETENNGKNQNIIDTTTKAYQISADELRDKVGEITSQNGTSVTIDSKKSGRTTLEGTVKVDGKVLEDAELATVYTSVQWNPIPKSDKTTSDAFVALLGQKIEVIAQLTDKNGNAVSESNHGIIFNKATSEITGPNTVLGAVGTATVVNKVNGAPNGTYTDANGQAKMILKASAVTELLDINAKSVDSQYNVKLIIAGQNTDKADLYWIDADLYFKDKVQSGFKEVQTTTDKPAVKTSDKPCDIKPMSGTSWMYGVQTKGTAITKGALAGKTITINGLGVTMTKATGSVGTITALSDVKDAVVATSTKAGDMKIVSKLDSATLTKDVTVSEGTFAGTGSTSVNKKLEIDVEWQAAGVSASYVLPYGTNITTGAAVKVFLKVTDAYGNGIKDKNVTFAVDGNASFDGASTATTDANGIATVSLNGTGVSGSTTTVSATVDGVANDVFEQTFTWVNNPKALTIDKSENQVDGGFLTNYDREKKTITLTFKDDVVASSVVKDLFTITYKYGNGSTPDAKLVIKSVAVDGNVVTLTLADVPATIDARDEVFVEIGASATVKGVVYKMTSITGAAYSKDITIKLNGTTAPSET